MSTGQSLVQLITDFVRGNGEAHKPLPRFLAAWWGSTVVHAAALVSSFGEERLKTFRDQVSEVLGFFLVILIVYAATFALIVALGVTKGSLVRHFLYGVVLPATAWFVGANLIQAIGG